MPKPDVTFILTITGVLFSFITIGLLVTSQIKQNWISYTFPSAGTTLYLGLTVPFTAITNADIGIWDTSFISVVTTAGGSTTTTDTLDSATTGYFSEGNAFIYTYIIIRKNIYRIRMYFTLKPTTRRR